VLTVTVDQRRDLAEQLRQVLRVLHPESPGAEAVAANLRRAAFQLDHLDDADLRAVA
jgi:cytochrome oxidase Cu insertion factor (SCO1/SenC/PrrC family)